MAEGNWNKTIMSITYDIATGTSTQSFSFPSGMDSHNCAIIGAMILTKYNSWVEANYDGGSYYGSIIYPLSTPSTFSYIPKVSDNAQKITFIFAQL